MGNKITISLLNFTAEADSCLLGGDTSFSFDTYYAFPVVDTGQTVDYTSTSGEDSDYVDVPQARSFSGPTQNSTYTSDYTTTDNVTGLIWKNCSGGTAQTYPWEEAFAPCSALNNANSGAGYAGRTDWRLPSVEELSSLPNYGRYSPAIDTDCFPNTVSSHYWSSSTNVKYSSKAWYVYFDIGRVDDHFKTNSYYVRCVSGP